MKIKLVLTLLAAAFCTLQASEDNLIRNDEFKEQKKYWFMSAPATFDKGVATLPLTVARKKDPSTVTASVSQRIDNIKPGKYEFSAYYKGEFRNLYIVMRGYTKENKSVNIIVKWLGKKDFIKAGDKPGWFKFFYQGTIPANVVRASIHIEPWGTKGQTIAVTGVEVAEAE